MKSGHPFPEVYTTVFQGLSTHSNSLRAIIETSYENHAKVRGRMSNSTRYHHLSDELLSPLLSLDPCASKMKES